MQTLNIAILSLVHGVCLVKVVSLFQKANTALFALMPCDVGMKDKALKYYLQNVITIIYKNIYNLILH